MRILGAALIVVLAAQLAQAFVALPNMADPVLGTPWAPYSDALGPWLDGGMSFLVGLEPPWYLYRPTIGLFWGSLLAATGRVELIPAFFAAWLAVLCALVVASQGDRSLRAAFVLVLGMGAITFPDAWARLNFNVDFAALAITATGAILVLHEGTRRSRAALLAGCACLGVAATIRGPMLFAGPVILVLRLLAMERAPLRVVVAAGAAFLAPFAVDLGMQRHFDTMNNGMQALYCVYADPAHMWTPTCKLEYLGRRPPGAEVMRGYLAFLASAEGPRAVLARLAWRAGQDVALLQSAALAALAIGAAALSSARVAGARQPTTPFVKAIALVAVVAAVPRGAEGTALAVVVAAAIVAGACGRVRALACLGGYLAGTLFLDMAGMAPHDRLQHTFGFLLPLGLALLALDDRDARAPLSASPAAPRVAASVAGALLFLYAGSFAIHGSLREAYHAQVFGQRGAALKVGDDARIDRSLYYTWDRKLVYVRHDALAIGTVRRYRELARPAFANASFLEPNAFAD